MGISVLTSDEYNLDLHISQKRKDWKLIFFSLMKKEELSFIFENNGSLMKKREKFVKGHNHNITCQWNSLSWIDYLF